MGEQRKSGKRPGKLRKAFRSGVSSVVRSLNMGHTHSTGSHSLATPSLSFPVNPDAPPLRFHRGAHGANIDVQQDGVVARRVESFCKGIVFSDRPVAVGERVAIRLTDLSSRWTGVLRVGFSAHDPSNLSDLPKYACPDLTNRPGYWAKALSGRYSESEVIVHYYVATNGSVHLGIDGHDRGVFFTGVDVRRPLWALIDLYGNCTGIEMIDLRSGLNNFQNEGPERRSVRRPQQQQQAQLQMTQQMQQQQQLIMQQQQQPNLPHYSQINPEQHLPYVVNDPVPALSSQMNHMQVVPAATHPSAYQRPPMPPPQQQPPVAAALGVSNPVPAAPTPNILPVRYNRHASFRPLLFHHSTGKYARLTESSAVAYRHEEEFAQCYVFGGTSIRLGERIVVQVLATEESYIGSLAFGLTNCDPSHIDTRELPVDSDLLLNRAEYWVASKDVASSPAAGDELSFCVRSDGSVEFSRNGQPPSVFMHVDASLRLFAFWDVYGHTAKIRLLGSTVDPIAPPPPPPAAPVVSGGPTGTLVNVHGQLGPETPSGLAECTVCFDRAIDCAIYTCGHMCMCHECAMQHWRVGGGRCPICRMEIKDIIRTFRA